MLNETNHIDQWPVDDARNAVNDIMKLKKGGAGYHKGTSKQDVGTPREFLDVVEKRFGEIAIDLAATSENKVCEDFLGPGSILAEDSLAYNWDRFKGRNCWLNPPFGDVKTWSRKCFDSMSTTYDGKILMLCPASVGTTYFRENIHKAAKVLFLSPRITFVGSTNPYPKDLMLCIYGSHIHNYGFDMGRYDCWRWK